MATNTTVVGTRAAKPKAAAGPWREAFGRLVRNKLAVVGLILVILLLFCGIFGPLIAPWPYQVQDLPAVFANGNRPLPPLSPNHILGTDQLGRDLLSRLLDGARISVTVAFVVQAVIILIGVPIGALAGWFGGRTDNALMRLTDVFLAIPTILSGLALASVVGTGVGGIVLVITALYWAWTSRLVFGETLRLRRRAFVEAAIAQGVPSRTVVRRHATRHSWTGTVKGVLTDPRLDVPSTATAALGRLWAVNARFGNPSPATATYSAVALPLNRR